MPDSLIVGNTSVFPGSLKKNKILITQRESGNVACKTLSHRRIKKNRCAEVNGNFWLASVNTEAAAK